MENQTQGILMKSRSASACIKEGYGLYTAKFRKTIAASWHFALLYAIACSAICTIATTYIPKVMTQTLEAAPIANAMPKGIIAMICTFCVLAIVGGVLEVATYSCGLSQLKSGFATAASPRKWWKPTLHKPMFVRCLIAALCSLLIGIVLAAVFFGVTYLAIHFAAGGSISQTAATITISAELAVMALIMMPLGFIAIKYVFRTDTHFWKLLAADYPTALKHYGFMLIVMLVSCIVIVVAEYILALPAMLLATASYQANIGVLQGDPLGMPGYITYVSAVVFFMAGFMQAYIRMSALFTAYYMYGSIETQEEERKLYKAAGKQENL